MKVEINVPSSLNDITLEQYQAFMRVYENTDSDEFIRQKMLSIFCKIPLSHVLRINAQSVIEVSDHLNKLFEGEKKFTNRFKLGGKEFAFIPELEAMEFGEYIDLENNIGDWQNMNKAMAVMFRPITKEKDGKYLIEQYEGTANYSDVMKYAPLDVVMGAVVFFYHLGNELLQLSLSYIQEEVTVLQRKNSSVNNGDGIKASTQSLTETLEGLRKLQGFHYPLVLPT